MIQLKTVVVEILQNYDVEVVKGQMIEPHLGLIFHMKHGLRVTIRDADQLKILRQMMVFL